MWLLTSVLQTSRLTVDQAAEYYEMRWGIEVEFRGLNQTLDRAHGNALFHSALVFSRQLSVFSQRRVAQVHEVRCRGYHPPNLDKEPLGDPQIRPLTPEEQDKLQAQNPGKATAQKSLTALPDGLGQAGAA